MLVYVEMSCIKKHLPRVKRITGYNANVLCFQYLSIADKNVRGVSSRSVSWIAIFYPKFIRFSWWLLIVVIIIGIIILGLCIVLCYYKVPKWDQTRISCEAFALLRLSLRSPREKKTVQIEVKAAEAVKTAGALVVTYFARFHYYKEDITGAEIVRCKCESSSTR